MDNQSPENFCDHIFFITANNRKSTFLHRKTINGFSPETSPIFHGLFFTDSPQFFLIFLDRLYFFLKSTDSQPYFSRNRPIVMSFPSKFLIIEIAFNEFSIVKSHPPLLCYSIADFGKQLYLCRVLSRRSSNPFSSNLRTRSSLKLRSVLKYPYESEAQYVYPGNKYMVHIKNLKVVKLKSAYPSGNNYFN